MYPNRAKETLVYKFDYNACREIEFAKETPVTFELKPLVSPLSFDKRYVKCQVCHVTTFAFLLSLPKPIECCLNIMTNGSAATGQYCSSHNHVKRKEG